MENVVLMYHDVYKTSVKESGFQSDGANHYKVSTISFEEQILRLKEFPITLTFDDGGVSFHTIIAPFLEKYGLRGRFYIATDKIGSEGFMSELQIRDLHQRGHVIGSHSCSHPSDFRELSFEVRKKEWEDSVQRLSDIIGEPVKEVSIPNGFLQEDDLPIFDALGITTIYTSKLGENRQYNGMDIVGRIGIDSCMSVGRIIKIISGGFIYKVMLVKQMGLSILKAILGNLYIKIKAIIRKVTK